MSTPALLNQLKQAMAQSPIFKVLPPEKQLEMQRAFEQASAEQVQQAIDQISLTDAVATKNGQARTEYEQHQTKATQQIKVAVTEFHKEELKENEAVDVVDSQKAADDLLATLNQKNGGASSGEKRGKFLGLF